MKGLAIAVIVISVVVALLVVLFFLLAMPVRMEAG
jgi:hypothetical protein